MAPVIEKTGDQETVAVCADKAEANSFIQILPMSRICRTSMGHKLSLQG
jgi:hypothetical protein